MFEYKYEDERLFTVPADLMAMDMAIQEKLELAIANPSKDPYLQQELTTLKRLRFAFNFKFPTCRKTLKLIHRSFRYDNEDQLELTNRKHLLALDYNHYRGANMEQWWGE